MCRRATSNKTRIETLSTNLVVFGKKLVAEQLPIKQGLKPGNPKPEYTIIVVVAEQLPIKQGLKHSVRTK